MGEFLKPDDPLPDFVPAARAPESSQDFGAGDILAASIEAQRATELTTSRFDNEMIAYKDASDYYLNNYFDGDIQRMNTVLNGLDVPEFKGLDDQAIRALSADRRETGIDPAWQYRLKTFRSTLPPEEQAVAPDPFRIKARGREIALSRYLASEQILQTGDGPLDLAATLAGGMTGAMTDPVNIASIAAFRRPITTIRGGLLYGGATSAATEALLQPVVQDYRAEVGLPAGFEMGLTNVLYAAGGGAFFGGVEGGFSKLGRYLEQRRLAGEAGRVEARLDAVLQRRAAGEYDDAETRDAIRALAEEEPALKAALEIAERRAALDAEAETNPFGMMPQYIEAHRARLANAEAEADGLAPPFDEDEFPAPLPAGESVVPPEWSSLGLDVVDYAALARDPKRFQFKDSDADGVTEALRGVEAWEPERAGLLLLWEAEDGTRYIANGHQRHALALRLMEGGHEPIQGPAIVLREVDGVTAEAAMVRGALINIAEGSGSSLDAARILRVDPEIGATLPPRSPLVREARGLAELSDEAFGLVINGRIKPRDGALVGKLVQDPALQGQIGLALARADVPTAGEAQSIIQDMLNVPVVEGKTIDLFGEADFRQALIAERAKVKTAALQILKMDERVFRTLTNQADRIEAEGNQLDAGANESVRMTAARLAERIEKEAHVKGEISDALNDAARRVADGIPPRTAAKGLVEALAGRGAGSGKRRSAGAGGRGADQSQGPGPEGGARGRAGSGSEDELAARQDALLDDDQLRASLFPQASDGAASAILTEAADEFGPEVAALIGRTARPPDEGQGGLFSKSAQVEPGSPEYQEALLNGEIRPTSEELYDALRQARKDGNTDVTEIRAIAKAVERLEYGAIVEVITDAFRKFPVAREIADRQEMGWSRVLMSDERAAIAIVKRAIAEASLQNKDPEAIFNEALKAYGDRFGDAADAAFMRKSITDLMELGTRQGALQPKGLFSKTLRSANEMTDQAVLDWSAANVRETEYPLTSTETQFLLHTRMPPGVRGRDIEIVVDLETRTGTAVVDMTLDGVAEARVVGKPGAQLAAIQTFYRTMIAVRGFVLRHPEIKALRFAGATDAHTNLYNGMLKRFDLPGFEGYRIVRTKADLDISADGTTSGGQPRPGQYSFVLLRQGEKVEDHVDVAGLTKDRTGLGSGRERITTRYSGAEPIRSGSDPDGGSGAGRSGAGGPGARSGVSAERISPAGGRFAKSTRRLTGFHDDLERGSEPFFDARLTPSQNKAAEMARNGYTNYEIAEELGTSPATVRAHLTAVRSKGIDVPKAAQGRPRRGSQIEAILARRAEGLTVNQISERLGVSRTYISGTLSRERARLLAEGEPLPDWLLPRTDRREGGFAKSASDEAEPEIILSREETLFLRDEASRFERALAEAAACAGGVPMKGAGQIVALSLLGAGAAAAATGAAITQGGPQTREQRWQEYVRSHPDYDEWKAAEAQRINAEGLADYVNQMNARARDWYHGDLDRVFYANPTQMNTLAQRFTGVSSSFLDRMLTKESSRDWSARPPINPATGERYSSAYGGYQFLERDWLKALRRWGPSYGFDAKGKSREELLDLRSDPRWGTVMAAELTRDNARIMERKLGRPVTEKDAYLAHFAGPETAAKLLRADPEADADKIDPRAAAANPTVYFYDKAMTRPKPVRVVVASLTRAFPNTPVMAPVEHEGR